MLIRNCLYCDRAYSDVNNDDICKSCGAVLIKDDFNNKPWQDDVLKSFLTQNDLEGKRCRKRTIIILLSFFLIIPVGGLITTLIAIAMFFSKF